MAPTRVAITGTPLAIASKITVGIPSERETDEITSASRPGISSATLVPASRKARLSPRPARSASSCRELS
jgi:hypothetical protein